MLMIFKAYHSTLPAYPPPPTRLHSRRHSSSSRRQGQGRAGMAFRRLWRSEGIIQTSPLQHQLQPRLKLNGTATSTFIPHSSNTDKAFPRQSTVGNLHQAPEDNPNPSHSSPVTLETKISSLSHDPCPPSLISACLWGQSRKRGRTPKERVTHRKPGEGRGDTRCERRFGAIQ